MMYIERKPGNLTADKIKARILVMVVMMMIPIVVTVVGIVTDASPE